MQNENSNKPSVAQVSAIKELADEAELQVMAAIDICNWVGAIARAIARDVETGDGRDVPVLTDLAKYFDDSGATCLSEAFKAFRQMAILHPVPPAAVGAPQVEGESAQGGAQ